LLPDVEDCHHVAAFLRLDDSSWYQTCKATNELLLARGILMQPGSSSRRGTLQIVFGITLLLGANLFDLWHRYSLIDPSGPTAYEKFVMITQGIVCAVLFLAVLVLLGGPSYNRGSVQPKPSKRNARVFMKRDPANQ
jgi:hypothetical protein